MQMQMNAYNNYNSYNPNYNNAPSPHWSGGNRMGSRRNSLKNYAAPPPPPMPPMNSLYRNEGQQTNRSPMPQQNYRNSYPPPSENPVQELQNLMNRRDGYEVRQIKIVLY